MNSKKITALTIELIQRYYNNDIQPFLDYMDEDILWYGPAKGQFLKGHDAAVKAWGNENNTLTFTLGDIKLDHITSHPSYIETIASYSVTTHYPSGISIHVDQISHFTWCERKIDGYEEKQPRMLVSHVSNLYKQHKEDSIYPVHYEQVFSNNMGTVTSSEHLSFHGLNHSDYYLMSDYINWIESTDNGRHSIIHTNDEAIHVNTSITRISEEYPDIFLRCHRCFLVNPRHVTHISRFKVVLSDKKELPIPEKKYTAFKKAVNDYFNQYKEQSLQTDAFKERLS